MRGSTAVMARRKNRRPSIDYYPTPPWATRALCNWMLARFDLGSKTCLDPAAGGGHMTEVLEEHFHTVFGSDFYDPANIGWDKLDFITDVDFPPVDWVITNPPFTLATDFALKAYEHASEGFALLCRTAFLESAGRYEAVFQSIPPTDILIFSERLSMVEGRLDPSASGATSHAWFVWNKFKFKESLGPLVHWLPPGTRARFEPQ